ncbi:MAG: hypothetical protein AAFY56_21510, partial [Pseudomonadota bacterium]
MTIVHPLRLRRYHFISTILLIGLMLFGVWKYTKQTLNVEPQTNISAPMTSAASLGNTDFIAS